MTKLVNLSEAWKGNEKLWRVYWLFWFPVGVIFNIVMLLLAKNPHTVAIMVNGIIAVLYVFFLIYSTIILIKCAFNVKHRFWSYLLFVVLIINWAELLLGFFRHL